MPVPTLTYFDFDGGRGEPARLALHIGGVAFEDRRIALSAWAAMRDSTPFQALPTLEVDGMLVTQSNAILRYAGKLAGLYPTADLSALLCDEILDAVEDIGSRIGRTIDLPAEMKQKAREELASGPIARHLQQLQAKLQHAGGAYFVDNRLTVADLKAFMLIRWLRSGALDHIPKDIVEQIAPALVGHFERVAAHPKITAYYASRQKVG